MIDLDENVIRSQRNLLLAHRLPIRQIGIEIGPEGIADSAILPILMHLHRPTFFTRDYHFYDRRLCHRRYCLVLIEARADEVARFVRLVLTHRELDTHAKRMGKVMRVSDSGLAFWSDNAARERPLPWMRLRR